MLSIYAIYELMSNEIARYNDKTLKALESHTAADQQSGALGDIEIANDDNTIFEALEIKHNIVIDEQIIESAYRKFRNHQLDRYYILSTHNESNSYLINSKTD